MPCISPSAIPHYPIKQLDNCQVACKIQGRGLYMTSRDKTSKTVKTKVTAGEGRVTEVTEHRPRGWNLTPEHQKQARAMLAHEKVLLGAVRGAQATRRKHGDDVFSRKLA